MWWMALALAGVLAINLTGLWWLARRVAVTELERVRLDRVGEAVALLSETTEAGMGAMAAEIERLQVGRTTRQTTRSTVARRVLKAAKQGEPVAHIARRESLSEGEVRLHLALATAEPPKKKGTRRASVRA